MQSLLIGILTRVPPLVVGFLAGTTGLVGGALAGAPMQGLGDPMIAASQGAFWAGTVGGLAALLCGLAALATASALQVDRASRVRFAASIAAAGWLGGALGLVGAVIGGFSAVGGPLWSALGNPGMLLWMSAPAPMIGVLLGGALALTATRD
jgi:hypothetical protein